MSDPQAILMCPGQGAQSVGMGKAWLEASGVSRQLFEHADDLMREFHPSLPASLSTICFTGPLDVLGRTDISQPALYVAGIASVLGSGMDRVDYRATAGLSLGEYTALYLAGAFSFEDGLRLVALRGQAMQQSAESVSSGMVALIGADEEQAHEICDLAREDDVLVCANFNAPGQIVVSGNASACTRAEQRATSMGLRASRLQVAGAFHSPLMKPAADRLHDALQATAMSSPRCMVLSNVTGEPHQPDVNSIKCKLVEQLTSPVRWMQNMQWLAQHAGQAHLYEVSPGKTLAGLARRIDKALKINSLDSPATPASHPVSS